MSRRYLMCRPTYFAVDYAINPWMDPTVPVDVERAVAQWTALHELYLSLGHTVDLIDPEPGLPDMVFAANGATVIDGKVYGAQFRHPERADEGPAYLSWFARHGFDVHAPKNVNEGEGDLLLAGDVILAGTGLRTEHAAHLEAQELFGRPVISLQLVDPRYYHLDTALTVLSHGEGAGDGVGNIAYYPEAFSPGSREVLRRRYPHAVLATAEDAAVLGLNGVSDGHRVVLPAAATRLARALASKGFQPVPVDVSELHKAGGGPKCCTLEVRS